MKTGNEHSKVAYRNLKPICGVRRNEKNEKRMKKRALAKMSPNQQNKVKDENEKQRKHPT